MVEALAVNAGGIGDAHEGIGVDIPDTTQGRLQLVLAHHDKQHLGLVLGIIAFGMQKRHAPFLLVHHHIGNLLVFGRIDKHLDAGPATQYNQVDRIGSNRHHHIAEQDDPYRLFQRVSPEIVEDKERRGNDEDIAKEDYPSRTDIVKLGNNQSHNVRPSGTSAVIEGNTNRKPDQGTAYHRRKKLFIAQDGQIADNTRPHAYKNGKHDASVNGLEAEACPQNLEADEQQDHIDDESRHRHRNRVPGSIVNQGGDTVHPAAHNLGIDNESNHAESVHRQTERDNDVTLDFPSQLLRVCRDSFFNPGPSIFENLHFMETYWLFWFLSTCNILTSDS